MIFVLLALLKKLTGNGDIAILIASFRDFLIKRGLTTSSITSIFGSVKVIINLSNRKK